MNQPKCLTEQELSEFVQGRIDAIRVEQIAEHLEACGDCQATVVMLGENSDTFVQQLRSPAVPDALEAEVACQDAVERLANRAASWRSGPTATLPDMGDLKQVGPYLIVGELGVGGMGTVYEAMHSKLKRTVALKILPASRWTNPLAVARFEREMEIIGQLDHPNIVRASDAGEENGMHYLVMEYVDGLDLSRIVNRIGTLGIADACEIARQAAIGLQYANENHLVHRDIKPSNLMLARAKGQESRVEGQSGGDSVRRSTLDSRPSTSVKILDLGLALLGEAHMAHENELTTVGQLMGTLDYMSPEQGMDSHVVDIRADIYSLGATLYKLLTGRAPFAAPQYNTLLKKVTALANQPVKPVKELRPDIPDELAAIIDRTLAKEPQDRFNTPNELAAALEPFARDADLSGLLAAALNATEPEARSLPAVNPSRDATPTPVASPKASNGRNGSRRWTLIGMLGGIFFFLFAAGIVIHISTDRGVLVVEADDDTEVLVRKDGVTVKELQVSKGENAVSVRSGNYHIGLKGESDTLEISNNTVTVKRGERTVIRIQQYAEAAAAPDSMMGGEGGYGGFEVEMMDMGSGSYETVDPDGEASMYGEVAGGRGDEMYSSGESMYGAMSGGFSGPPVAPAKPTPTYDGKTYSQWLAELKTERKPERLTEAIRAFASLGEDDQEIAAQSAETIMRIMRRNGSYVIDSSPQGKLIDQAITVLREMPSEVVIEAIEAELPDGNTRSRSFVNLLLLHGFYGYSGVASPELTKAAEQRRDSLYRLLLTLPDDEAADVRANAISLVVNNAKSKGIAFDKIEGLVPKLHATLKEKDLKLVAVGATQLVWLDPDNKDLVPALTRLMTSKDYSERTTAVRHLGHLGTRSHAAVNQLIEIIRPIVEPKSNASADPYGGGMEAMGGYGGGMGAGGAMYGGGYAPAQDINYVAIEALGKIGNKAQEAVPLLRKIVEQGTPDEGQEGGGGFGGGGGGFGGKLSYAGVATTAINRIEGKEPIPTASEEGDEASSATRSGGFF
ncbi:MAG: serine/threonine protein kinase [Planctomycetales bacterium]|nr:serine/threonine protein kinase [Planctomycetales bacterium]